MKREQDAQAASVCSRRHSVGRIGARCASPTVRPYGARMETVFGPNSRLSRYRRAHSSPSCMIRSARMRSAASRRVSLASFGDKSRARDDATCKSIRTSLARRLPTLPICSRISRIVSAHRSRRRLISCGVSFSISLAALINSEIKAGMEDMAGNVWMLCHFKVAFGVLGSNDRRKARPDHDASNRFSNPASCLFCSRSFSVSCRLSCRTSSSRAATSSDNVGGGRTTIGASFG